MSDHALRYRELSWWWQFSFTIKYIVNHAWIPLYLVGVVANKQLVCYRTPPDETQVARVKERGEDENVIVPILHSQVC